MRFFAPLVVLLLVASGLAAMPAQAQVDPGVVCLTNSVPLPAVEERFFCEPMDSIGFVQFEQFVAGLHFLESTYPDFIEVKEIGRSVLDLPIYFVEVTNKQSPVPREDKLQIGYSASIHANEAAGREGMTRVIEDLAAGKGPDGARLQPLLDHLILNVWFPNPDSWASGDYFRSDMTGVLDDLARFGFHRANAMGVDLNRQFPNPGWIHPPHNPANEPEAQAVVKELRYSGDHTNLVAGADLHGMINSPNMIRMIIPNQDYDLRRMVLIVDQLRTVQERVEADPAFAEWTTVDQIADAALGLGLPTCIEDPTGLVVPGGQCLDASAVHDKPMEWGARWDMIGYTDTGFTSDYMTLSPRSPTGGMGAVGTITEFAYSHMVPDNRYVAKLTDMHVAGVRQIVATQMEMALRLETPVLTGTGPVAYVWTDDSIVSSKTLPEPYVAAHGKDFDLEDESTWFDFNQVAYEVSNLHFWRDLGRFSSDPVDPIDAARLDTAALEGYRSLALTDLALDALTDDQVTQLRAWVEAGGHLVVTDSALRFLDRSGITRTAVQSQCVYVGHSNLEDMDHPLVAGVDWGARVTGEASALGFKAKSGDRNYPQWGVDRTAFESAGGQVVGTTAGSNSMSTSCDAMTTERLVSIGRLPVGQGTIDLIGGALPQPTQAYDHRYGLADYSVSALTYWVVMNSLGGAIAYEPIDEPFVPYYAFDPIYGEPQVDDEDYTPPRRTPGLPVLVLLGALVALAVSRRRQ